MAIVIRPAVPEDAHGIAYVRVTTWRAAYVGLIADDFLAALDMEEDARRWHGALSQKETYGRFAFVAEEAVPDGQAPNGQIPDRQRPDGQKTSGRVVGFSIAGPERTGDAEFPAELYALYVLPEYQGQGLGRALVKAVAGWLREQSYPRMIIYVLRSNWPSRKFYEAIGGTLAREKEIEIGGAPLAEVGYGYDLEQLA